MFRHVLATDNTSFCQVSATSPAKGSSTLNFFASSFHETVYQKRTHAGSSVKDYRLSNAINTINTTKSMATPFKSRKANSSQKWCH